MNDLANKDKVLIGMVAITLLVLGSVVGFLACQAANDDTRDPTSRPTVGSLATTASATEHNAAAVSFAQVMVPHRTRAFDMAELARTRAASVQVSSAAPSSRRTMVREDLHSSGGVG